MPERARDDSAHDHLGRVFGAAPLAMLIVALDGPHAGRIVTLNRACCEFLGCRESEATGTDLFDLIHADDRAAVRDAIASLGEGEAAAVPRRVQSRWLRAGGQTVWGELTTTSIDGVEGQERCLVGMLEDITDRKQAELDLPAIANVLRRILSGEDARETIVHAAVEIAGASSAHLIELSEPEQLAVTASAELNLVGVEVRLDAPSVTADVFLRGEATFRADPEDDPLVSRQLLELARARSIMWQPIRNHERVIGVLCVCWAERVADVSARAARAVALLTDETAVALAHHDALERLAAQATTDPLTGLPNRRAWDDRLGRELVVAARDGRPLTLALLDMDRFKHYNDTRGHAAGDELLRDFAAHAQVLLREGDTFARWGGEEFAVLLPDCPSDTFATGVLQRIREAVPGGQSCSVGYATWDGRERAEDLVARADRALYRAKTTGRDRVAAADLVDHQAAA